MPQKKESGNKSLLHLYKALSAPTTFIAIYILRHYTLRHYILRPLVPLSLYPFIPSSFVIPQNSLFCPSLQKCEFMRNPI